MFPTLLFRRSLVRTLHILFVVFVIHYFLGFVPFLRPSDQVRHAQNGTDKTQDTKDDLIFSNALTKASDSSRSKISQSRVMKIMDFNPKPNCAHRLKFKKCEFDACAMTTNPQEADIVMFNAVNMKDLILPKRPIGQIVFSQKP
ncbi:glycoprotein 3-alpha-L-fucosyltransferase A-like isoform X1 [Biomphalaria pfeifferi]|uniref:Glycoprotein 3-alpha-L-fucosyltransferase A-like isoform X1 n=1 Tax=Biomphalaria pfeifferi TaxID=112525 RepID=A0AAD8FET9_BIOPF|nr:glycoprotein 3-alpha-L-fucosyltransferase A-like isoform X1 [Biomphalaria pfeifferi]